MTTHMKYAATTPMKWRIADVKAVIEAYARDGSEGIADPDAPVWMK